MSASSTNTNGGPKPRVLVSACLGFAALRYDGSAIFDGTVDRLRSAVEFIPVCPEVAIGLGSPRAPLRLVSHEGFRLLQPATGADLTEPMRRFAEAILRATGEIDGVLLKSRSPSCAVRDARVYRAGPGAPPVGRAPGLFAAVLLERSPWLPAEDEGRLRDADIRAHFLDRVFASALVRSTSGFAELLEVHATHKLLLFAHHPRAARALGRWLAEDAPELPFPVAKDEYRRRMLAAMTTMPTVGRIADALFHLYGFFRRRLNPRERQLFLETMEAFREGRTSAATPAALLRSWAARFGEPYVADQRLLRALMLRG